MRQDHVTTTDTLNTLLYGTGYDNNAQGPQCFSSLLYALSSDARDNKGRTPLDMAIENNTSAAIYLMNHGSSMCCDKERGKLLCKACSSGKLDMVKKLVEQHKVDPKGQYVYSSTQYITLHYHTPLNFVFYRCEG